MEMEQFCLHFSSIGQERCVIKIEDFKRGYEFVWKMILFSDTDTIIQYMYLYLISCPLLKTGAS